MVLLWLISHLIVFRGIQFGADLRLWTKTNSGTAQMCNTPQRGGGGGRLYDLTYVTKDANREKIYILSLIGVKTVFYWIEKKMKESLLMATHSVPKPWLQFCPNYRSLWRDNSFLPFSLLMVQFGLQRKILMYFSMSMRKQRAAIWLKSPPFNANSGWRR